MRNIFSAIVVSVLLIIYAYLVWFGIQVIGCIEDTACNALARGDFNDRMASSLALINGLVSALVVAELAKTNPGQLPMMGFSPLGTSPTAVTTSKILAGVYLAVWLVAGLAAFVVGYLFADPDTLPPLADLGQAWLGVAVGAGYAYFQLKDKDGNGG